MNLYQVQDSDRPMFVIATSWMAAVEMWKEQIAEENKITPADMNEPNGINLICEGSDTTDMPELLFPFHSYEVIRLKNEIQVLRQYGNKDCTAMADEALKKVYA